MADKVFNDFDTLALATDKALQTILKKDVAPVAEDILVKHISYDIYGSYFPKEGRWVCGTTYERRFDLWDEVTSYIQKDGSLLITSTAKASPSVVQGWSFRNRYDGAFLKLLEKGKMGIWRGGFPRPAVSNAQAEIDSSSKITRAIKNGIKREIGNCEEIL